MKKNVPREFLLHVMNVGRISRKNLAKELEISYSLLNKIMIGERDLTGVIAYSALDLLDLYVDEQEQSAINWRKELRKRDDEIRERASINYIRRYQGSSEG